MNETYEEQLEELIVRINKFSWNAPHITFEYVYEEVKPWMRSEGLVLDDYYRAFREMINRGWLVVYPYTATNIQYRKPSPF